MSKLRDHVSKEMQGVPHKKRHSKFMSLIHGGIFVVAGFVVMGGGIWLIVNVKPFSPWLLIPFGAGFVLVLYGSNIASREAAEAALSALSSKAKELIPFVRKNDE